MKLVFDNNKNNKRESFKSKENNFIITTCGSSGLHSQLRLLKSYTANHYIDSETGP